MPGSKSLSWLLLCLLVLFSNLILLTEKGNFPPSVACSRVKSNDTCKSLPFSGQDLITCLCWNGGACLGIRRLQTFVKSYHQDLPSLLVRMDYFVQTGFHVRMDFLLRTYFPSVFSVIFSSGLSVPIDSYGLYFLEFHLCCFIPLIAVR